jgi:two-component system sensor histidine kinase UhpB
VFAANAAVFALAIGLVAATPLTIHTPIRLVELVILLGGVGLMLLVDLLLLRHTLTPLRRLESVMGMIDLARPGQRADGFERSSREIQVLARSFNAMLDRLEQERRQSASRVLAAQESERLRIARELHDEIGQTLTAVALRAEHAAGLTDRPQSAGAPRRPRDDGQSARAREELAALAALVQGSLQDVRRISRELRPEALDDLGLRGALMALCARVSEQGNVRVHRRIESPLPELAPEVELASYRIVQEALTNVMRHSGATDAAVSLERSGDALQLVVSDNGCGLPPGAEAGIGISGMRERALLIGGSLKIGAAGARGVVVSL